MNYMLETAIMAAKESGKIQMAHLDKETEITYKGEINIVTEVDKLCERNIISIISDHYPDHSFLAEEEMTDEAFTGKYRWIIDPLDGTTNYAHGYRCFCTSIALQREDEVILGVVYDPVTNELFYAEKGKGAFLNGVNIHVSDTTELTKSLLSTGFPYDIREGKKTNLEYFNTMAIKAQAIRRDGAAALDLCYLAAGRFDGFWELKLMPWDMAAGALVVTEAGGTVTNLNNGELNIFNDDILATNGLIHEEMLGIISNVDEVEMIS